MNAQPSDSSSNHQAETIRPKTIARNRVVRRRQSLPLDFVLGVAFCAVLVAIIVGGLWLYRDLTQTSEPSGPTATAQKEPSSPPEPSPGPVHGQKTAPDEEGVLAAKNLAQERRRRYHEARATLEENGARQWDSDGYNTMAATGQQAEALWLEKRYGAAANKYAVALAQADRLSQEKDGTLQQTLNAAQRALTDGDVAKATELFALAKLMDPENGAAENGLKRAQSYEQVAELIQTGQRHEKKGDLDAGKTAYEKALALDPDAREAAAGLHRINALKQAAQFKVLMSEGLNAIDQGDFATARSKLVRASQMQPDNPAIKDAMARLEQSARVDEIKRLQRSALAAESQENWEQALAFYLMALELDPNLQFAKKGRIHTQDRIRITKRMRFLIANPDALAQDPQLQNALALIDEAQQLKPRGPQLEASLGQLQAIVTAAATPIKVIITSDEQTHVAVYKVGRLGRFKQHALDLRPGTYTVVGSRDGYQDVRQQIVVKPGQQTIHITIACTVKI